jgi:peptidoglycan/LPS O-acetylase OafA/YrhL
MDPNVRIGSASRTRGHQYWPALDGVRGIAITAVVLLHLGYGSFRGGFLGVDLFFALSGFLITHILAEEWRRSGTIDFGRFYMRRVLRLYPALAATVVLAFFVWPTSQSSTYGRAAIAALFYHMNLIDPGLLNPLAHTWSLSVEEQFYVFWPPLLFLLMPLRKQTRLAIIFLMIFGSIGVRVIMLHGGARPNLIYHFTFARTDSLLCGCAAAQLLDWWNNKVRSHPKLTHVSGKVAIVSFAILCCLFLTSLRNDFWLMTWGYTAVGVLCAALIMVATSLEEASLPSMFLRSPIMTYLGTRSYGLYLYHFVIFEKLESFRRPHSLGNFIIVSVMRVGLALVCTELSFRFLESPFLKLKRHFEQSRTPKQVVQERARVEAV